MPYDISLLDHYERYGFFNLNVPIFFRHLFSLDQLSHFIVDPTAQLEDVDAKDTLNNYVAVALID